MVTLQPLLSCAALASVLAAAMLTSAWRAADPPAPRFAPSSSCLACHNGLTTPAGEDVSIGAAWRGSMMANSARDPYWQASVRRETLDHPAHAARIEDECAVCHMPMARAEAAAAGAPGAVFAHLPLDESPAKALAADGVSCTLCHQIRADGLGHPDSFNGGFSIASRAPAPSPREIFGPFPIEAGLRRVMHSSSAFLPAQADHIRKSELCATCHTLYTEALGPDGAIVGRLPEQMPYLEWRHSAYRDERSCQDCHMPRVAAPTPIASVLGAPREGWGRHGFRGGNAFMIRLLDRYRGELAVTAPAGDFERSARATEAFLEQDTARLTIPRAAVEGERLAIDVEVRNLAGHKLPTGYPSRRVWLHVTVRDASGGAIFESGALASGGAIADNDNDLDPAMFEPHHQVLTRGDQVQIYESILADVSGAVTTGLLRGVRYLKDNRLLPRGFDKARAAPDIAVHGDALADDTFDAGGDVVRYRLPITPGTGAVSIEAELLYQPIAFRWARNLTQQRGAEITRFVAMYDATASGSATRLAVAAARVAPPAP